MTVEDLGVVSSPFLCLYHWNFLETGVWFPGGLQICDLHIVLASLLLFRAKTLPRNGSFAGQGFHGHETP